MGHSSYMEGPEKEVEEKFLLDRLLAALRYTFPKTTVALDEGERDEDFRPFEKFEVFFMLPKGCTQLDGHDIDSTLVFEMLTYQAVRVIEERYKQMLPRLPAPVRGIGIHRQTKWAFDDEVLEAEAMLGDAEDPDDIPARWTFWARYVMPIDQKAARCKTAPIHLPPELPQRAGTQWVVTPEGLIREELIEKVEGPAPLHRWKSEDPYKTEPEQYGYELEEEEEEEGWET